MVNRSVLIDYLTADNLWAHVENRTRLAHAKGSIHSIPTHMMKIEESGIAFQVRVIDKLEHTSRAIRERVSQKPLATNSNPFMPYDENLYVGELNAHYRCLLNKFNVISGHILLVTSKFAEQLAPLTTIDFETAMLVLQAKEGLVFYNGGEQAGASVRHKHLQMIPVHDGNDNRCPMEALFETDLRPSADIGRLLESTTLPFPHRVARSHFSQLNTDLASIALENYNLYSEMLKALALAPGDSQPVLPHNLLITRRYLWVIPRSKDNHAGIAVNALGFSGALLLINNRQLEILSRTGILAMLREVVF